MPGCARAEQEPIYDGWEVHQGDAVEIIPAVAASRSVDLVYMDPPFFTQEDWTGKAGSFSDIWAWDSDAKRRRERLAALSPTRANFIQTICGGETPLHAYVLAIADLVWVCRHHLKRKGVLLLHCDDHAKHILRVVGDMIFGPQRSLGEALWKRSTGQQSSSHAYPRTLDTVLGWSVRCGQRPIWDLILDISLPSQSTERVGYPTQKPVRLLTELIARHCPPGGLVLDPCCGSGTTLVAARETGRFAIGIDRNPDAVAIASKRIEPPIQLALFDSIPNDAPSKELAAC